MLTIDQLTGKDPNGLVPLPIELSSKDQQLAHPEAIQGLIDLQRLATKQNLPFLVVSSYRSFEQQKSIWNRKYVGELPILDIDEEVVQINSLAAIDLVNAIMLFSALPGASRHHWGSDFDIFPKAAILDGYHPQLLFSEFTGSGVAAEFNQWLSETLPGTEFFRPYEKYQQGIACEPWHISYLAIAKPALSALTVTRLHDILSKEVKLAGQNAICDNISSLHQKYINNICTEVNNS